MTHGTVHGNTSPRLPGPRGDLRRSGIPASSWPSCAAHPQKYQCHRKCRSACPQRTALEALFQYRTADILPAQMYVGIGQPENLDRIWVIPGCRDQSVKAWSGPVKSRTARTRRKVTGGPGGARSSWRQGTGTSGRRPPRPRAARPGAGLAPRTTESRTARGIGRKSPFAKRAPGDGRPVGAIAVTPGDRRQSAVSSK